MCLCHVCPASGASSQRLCAIIIIITITINITFLWQFFLIQSLFFWKNGENAIFKKKEKKPLFKNGSA